MMTTKATRHLKANYHTFDSTGDDVIDAILEAIAIAGGCYSTEHWHEHGDCEPYGYWSLIQQHANAAASHNAVINDALDSANITNPSALADAVKLLKRLAAYKSGPTKSKSNRAEWIAKMLDMADEARAALAALREEGSDA